MWGLLFEGSVLAYNLATNSMEWITVRGTVNDLSPMEDALAQELSNITIPDSLEDAPRIDCFGEHWQECIAEAPVEVFHTGIVPHEGEEVMEELLSEGENISSDSSEELDSDVSTPWCHCSDSISWTEEGKEGEELAEESTEELTEEPTKELAGGPNEELTEEPTTGPTEGLTKETAVEHLTSE